MTIATELAKNSQTKEHLLYNALMHFDFLDSKKDDIKTVITFKDGSSITLIKERITTC